MECDPLLRTSILVGLDPGARDTGIVGIRSDNTVSGVTVHNDGDLLPVPPAYLRDVITELDRLTDGVDHVLVCVESIHRPNWHVGKGQGGGAASNPEALIGTAMVLGAVLHRFPDATLVPPGRNGSRPLRDYPAALVSDGERRRDGWEDRVGTGKLRHQRSAWDVAKNAGALL